MCSPLAPLLANWLVSRLETDLLNKTKKPKMFCRYVTAFSAFSKQRAVHLFDKEPNKMHKDMKFVVQTCQEGKLPFLNTQVAIKNNKIITSIYRKPTRTGFLLILTPVYRSCGK